MAKDSISPGLLLLLILSLAIIEISHQQEVDGVEMSTTSANLSNETDGYPSLAINKTYIEEFHYDPYHALILWHGNFMLFACLVLAPVGVYVARFFKEVWSTTVFFGIPIWLLVHFAYMLATIMFMFLGLVFAKAHRATEIVTVNSTNENNPNRTLMIGPQPIDDYPEKSNPQAFHRYAGWAAFGLLLFQFCSGHFLPFSSDSVRPIYRMLHWGLGIIATYLCIIIAMMSVSLGGSQYPYFSAVVILAWIIFAIFMTVAGALTMHIQDKEGLLHDLEGKLVYYRAFWPFPIPIINFDEEPKDSFFRTVLFVWFQFGCLAAFSIIMVPFSLGLGHYDCLEYSFFNFDCAIPRTHTIY